MDLQSSASVFKTVKFFHFYLVLHWRWIDKAVSVVDRLHLRLLQRLLGTTDTARIRRLKRCGRSANRGLSSPIASATQITRSLAKTKRILAITRIAILSGERVDGGRHPDVKVIKI